MNYILHLNKTFEKVCEDDRLSPFHVSLYYSLFQYWNMARFRNPISISRDEVMRASKIGSVNTYIRCMKELDQWSYIQYKPSYNPQRGSQVYLFNFNNSNNNASDISNNKGNHKTHKKAESNADEKLMRPSINNSNNTNISNSVNEHEPKRTTNNRKSSHSSGRGIKEEKEKLRQKKKSSAAAVNEQSNEQLPTLEQVQSYFTTKQWPPIEAEKFFNYFQSNGWLVGGKTPMKNWHAAARNWILNSEKFNNGKTNQSNSKQGRSSRAANLQSNTNKNYNESL